jgi:hypothetical protein
VRLVVVPGVGGDGGGKAGGGDAIEGLLLAVVAGASNVRVAEQSCDRVVLRLR